MDFWCYKPDMDEAQKLFIRYNEYMYAILLDKIKISKEEQIVWKHGDSGIFNAQLAIQESMIITWG